MKKSLLLFVIVFSLFFVFIQDIPCREIPVIGIVLSVEGNVLQQIENRDLELEKGSRVLLAGNLVLPEKQRKGHILIGTNAGPVLYTRFPVRINKQITTPLSEDLLVNYLACSGGSVIDAKGIGDMKNLTDLFVKVTESLITDNTKEKPLVVALDNFVYADKGIGSGFSTFIESQLSIALTRSDSFTLFARNKLDKILDMQELNISSLTEGGDVRIGELKNIDALLNGQFFDDNEDILIFLNLVDIGTGVVTGNISFPLDKKLVPSSISILPSNTQKALDIIEDLSRIGKSEDKSLVIRAWPAKGAGGTYYENEELVVSFQSNRDCYIKIYHIDVNNNMTLIFPNKYHSNNRIKKDTLYKIPDKSYEFAFVLGKPYGTEFIKIIASTTQFKDIETAFELLGEGSSEMIERGLAVEQRKGKLAEVLFSYTILEKMK